jgi:hypothetical protein
MQVNLSQAGTGNKTVIATLKALGLELKDLKGLNADQQFELLADRIASLRDPADRARAATELFGKAGAQLLPLFSEGAEGIRKAREEAEKFGLAFSTETIEALQKGDDAMKKLSATWDGWMAKLAVSTVALAEWADVIDKDRVGELQDQLEAVNDELREVTTMPEGGPFDEERYKALSKEAEILKRQIDNLNSSYTRGGGGRRGSINSDDKPTAPGFEAQDSDEFTKISEQLREQTVLFQATTKEAEIAYKIQVGAIEGLKEGEAERLLLLARQHDALILARDLEKERAEQVAKEIENLKKLEEEMNAAAENAAADMPEFEGGLGVEDVQDDFEEYLKKLDRAKELTDAARTPQQDYNDTIAELIDLLHEGIITEEEFGAASKKAAEDMKKAQAEANKEWTVFRDQAARNTQDILADALLNGFDEGADGVLRSFAQMLQKLAAQAIAAKIAEKIFGGKDGGGFDFSSLFGGAKGGGGGGGGGFDLSSIWGIAMNYFGGARATGGPVTGGVPYLVGESGPEMIVPRGSGNVIPNNKLIGAPEVNVPLQIVNVKDPSEIPRFFASEEGARTFTNLMTDNASMARQILQGA